MGKNEDSKKEDAKEEAKMEEESEDEPEPVITELDDEEKKKWFKPGTVPDVNAVTLSSSFASFSIPDQDECFEEIAYDWRGEVEAKEYLKNWITTRKKTTRMENLQPSEW